MKMFATLLTLGGLAYGGAASGADSCPPILDFEKRRLAGDEVVRLCDAYAGQVILVVNTASKCAFTGQYEGLEALYRRYKDRGFVVLGFPSNDFGNQEPGTEQQIQQFCRLTYSVEFPMFEKTRVKKGVADPMFEPAGPGGRCLSQVELLQVPDRPERQGRRLLLQRHLAREQQGRLGDRGPAVARR